MKKQIVKVIVDYASGDYQILGIQGETIFRHNKPIRGYDTKDGVYKASYSRRLIKYRQKEMEKDIKNKILAKDPDFKYSKKMIKKVDPLMYKALEDWDIANNTTYALDYLKIMIQEFPKNEAYYHARSFWDDNCAIERNAQLNEAGIDMTYNLSVISPRMNIFDIIKGFNIARKQQELTEAKVKTTFLPKYNFYLDDLSREDFEIEVPEVEDSEIVISEQANIEREIEQPTSNYVEDEKIIAERIKIVSDIIKDKKEIRNTPDFEIPDFLRKQPEVREQPIELEIPDFLKKQPDAQEQPVETTKIKKAAHKRTVRKPVAKTNDLIKKSKKKSKVYTGQRNGLTKKQREQLARKSKKAENSHYNTQMRLKAEKEAKRAEAKIGMERAAEERKIAEQKRINKEKEIEQKRILAENRQKTIEEELERQRTEEAQRIENERILELKRLETKRLSQERTEKARKERLESIFKNKYVRRFKAAKRSFNRKIHSSKESIKNMKSVVKTKSQEKIVRFKRKLRSAKDSVKNMKFNPNINKYAKKIAITGVITGFAVLVAFGSMKGINNNIKDTDAHESNYSTESVVDIEDTGREDFEFEEKVPESKPTESEQETSNKETEQEQEKETEKNDDNKQPEDIEESEQENTENVEETDKEQESESNDKTEDIEDKENEVSDKTEEEKLEELSKLALQKYEQAIVIGETPQIADMLKDQTFSQNPDGSGKKGYFSVNSEYSISHINIVTNEGYETVRIEGKSLSDLLAEYPDYITYNVHFVNSKTGGGLGFITQEQYEKMIQNKVNNVIQSKTDKTQTLEDDFIR